MTAVADGIREVTARRKPKSILGKQMFEDLMSLPPEIRRDIVNNLPPRDLREVLMASGREAGTEYGLYVDDPVGFVEDVLAETTWSKQREVLEALTRFKQVAVPSAFGTGKCAYYRDMIPLADGRMIPAGELVGTEFEVMAWQEDGTQVRRRARAEWNAVETVYRVTTSTGREITRNAAHPLWAAEPVRQVGGHTPNRLTPTPRGWAPVGALAAGDLVLVPEKHHAEGTQRRDRDHVALLGYLLGDGGTTDRQITFTQQDGEGLDEFFAIADRMNVDLVPKKDRPYCYRLVGRLLPGEHPKLRKRTNQILALVDEWGLAGKNARQKRFPDWAWTLPNDQLALLLGRLFACDGWAYMREHRGRLAVQVAIALSSEGMIRDIEAAMLRLGIIGSVRHRQVKYNGGLSDVWQWECTDRATLAKLPDLLDIPGKNHTIARIADHLTARGTTKVRSWQNRNAPAGYRWEKVRSVEELPQPEQTVAIEVDGEHTFVTSYVEHNTHIAARAALWRSLVYPPGTSLTVTTATRLRQVQRQLWPHIRTAVAKANLPLIADMTQLKAINTDGVEVQVAYGFSAPAHDEAAVQGIHAPRLFIVVDEAGGISRVIGKAMRGLLTGDDTRMLAIGNPPTDDEGSWFEGLCESEKAEMIQISAYASPQLSGEKTDYCRACPPGSKKHRLSIHIVDKEWIVDTIEEYGEDAPFVIAKVHANFPRGGSNRIIPADWVDMAWQRPEPEGEEYRPLNQLSSDETEEWMVKMGSWVRLGVDVASDGGDELVIARSVGDLQTIQHASSGAVNANAVDVAGKVLTEIVKAQKLRGALESPLRVRLKIDGIGVGWGVASLLEAWRTEGVHDTEIVVVKVSEATGREPGDALMRPALKRDEMWIAGRKLLQPSKGEPDEFGIARAQPGQLRLRVEKRTRAQLSGPKYGTRAAGGTTVIESKQTMKSRGIPSPDRAEALLLAVYEPLDTGSQGAFQVLV